MAGSKIAALQRPGKSGPVVLDSSCWIEYFRDTARADFFAELADTPEQLIVPVITVYEVTKKFRRELDAGIAASADLVMRRGKVVAIDLPLVRLAITYDLPLADSLIYATAQLHNATLWTQDAHFDGKAGVRYFGKTA
jgi:predicted nucleic acid-binding protein